MRCIIMEWTLLLCFTLMMEFCAACPTFCSCKWKNGKQTVECINKDLVVIPESMDSGTQVLEFCGNNLQTLHKDKFLRMGLINLQRIYLCQCRISNIDDRTFKGLTNLVELDLSGNRLESVPTETFIDCPSLMRLILNMNPIKTVRKSAFEHLNYLTTLEVSRCEIAVVEEHAFDGLHKLEWLHMDGNRMTTLQGTKYLPASLKGIQLQENPWTCDCHMLELHAWLRSLAAPHTIEPVCQAPNRLRSRTIKSVPAGELACLPEVSPTVFYLEIGEGKNVTLTCKVHAVPEAKVSWTFQGQLLQNDSLVAPGLHLLYFLEDGTIDKHSELLIYNLNSEDNGTFVCHAENPAGGVQANFTIRIVMKQDMGSASSSEVPLEFVLITLAAAGVSIILLSFVCVLSMIRCQRNNARLKAKRNTSKVTLSNSTKDNLLESDSVDDYKEVKEEETMLYTPQPVEVSPPAPLQANLLNASYQIERNPDLINGTESVGRFHNHHDLYVFAPDVHLNPVTLLEPEPPSVSCYKTLPYRGKRGAANPLGRYSREAEFLSNQPASYEHYCTDVRHTADGYPVRTVASHVPSPKSDSAACCSSSAKVNWPQCVPAGILRNKSDRVKSVAAQTEQHNTAKIEEMGDNLDEGYEGDSTDNQQGSC